jgi:23S rRNA A2030 N6-methylase RlmJ
MNYRHAFHAGNFADVLKHAVLVRILVHLRAKPAAFRVIDTHAGAGRYDLNGPEAARSLEWREGIERLVTASIGEQARGLLAPYLDAIAAFNGPGGLTSYPGSPALVRAFLRPQDRLLACELEPNAAVALARYLAGDRRSKALAIDGWTALHAYVPPKERRGLVLIDPSFEDAGDFARLGQARSKRRNANGPAAPICCGIRSRSAWGRTRSRAACGGAASERFCAPNSAWAGRAPTIGSGLAGSSSSIRRGRSQASLRSCCRSLRRSSREAAAAPTASIGWQAKSSFATFPQPWISIFSCLLALTFRLLWGPAE